MSEGDGGGEAVQEEVAMLKRQAGAHSYRTYVICGNEDHSTRMTVDKRAPEKRHVLDSTQTVSYHHACVDCIGTATCCTLAEVRYKIRVSCGKPYVKRAQEHSNAKRHILSDLDILTPVVPLSSARPRSLTHMHINSIADTFKVPDVDDEWHHRHFGRT